MVEPSAFNRIVAGSNPVTLTKRKEELSFYSQAGNHVFIYRTRLPVSRVLMRPYLHYWNLRHPKLSTSPSAVFYPLLYLLLIKRLGSYPSFSPSSIFWNQIYIYETRRIRWLKKRLFSRSRYEFQPALRFSKLLDHTTPTVPVSLKLKSHNVLWHLFLQTWALTRPKGNIHYSVEKDFRLFFLALAKKSPQSSLVNPRGYYNRWINSYNFVFNLFFVDSFAQLMGSRFFIEEALVFNWHYSYKNYRLYKFVQPFIMFSDTPHGEFIHDVVARLLTQNVDFLIVVDLRSHDKLLKYLKRYHAFMVGLTPINYSPWTVSYPIPAFSDSHLTQYYFLRFILKLQVSARVESYSRRYAPPRLSK